MIKIGQESRENSFGLVAEGGSDCVSPTQSLPDTTTQNTDDHDIQAVSAPESLRSCVLPYVRVGHG